MAVAKISVVTVCLNVRDTIRLTLESVARQTFPNIEHVIIDGVSTDGTLDIVREYPVAYLLSEKDKGVYDAMDKGSRAVTGDIVIFLNAGDTFYDDEVCERVAAFFDESGADIVFGDLLPVYLKTSDTHDHGAFTSGQVLDLSYVLNRRFLYNESIHHQATFYRRWVVKKCTYACSRPEATGEYNVLLKAVMKLGAKVKHIPIPVSRFALGGISTSNFEGEWARYVAARDILRSLYCPNFDALRVKDEMEFRHAPVARPLTRIERRTALKQQIKRSLFFRIYDRLARGMTTRVANLLAVELHAARQASEAQSHQLLFGIEANFRAHLAETQGELTKIQRELETIKAQRKPDLSGIEAAVERRLGELTAAAEVERETLEAAIADRLDALAPIEDALAYVRDSIATLDDRSARDIGAILEAVTHVRESVTTSDQRSAGDSGTVVEALARIRESIATFDQRSAGDSGTVVEALARIRESVATFDQRSARDIGAIMEALARAPLAAAEMQVWARAAVEGLAQVQVALASDSARETAFNAILRQTLEQLAERLGGHDVFLNNIAADLKSFAGTLVMVHDRAELSAGKLIGGIDDIVGRIEGQAVALHEAENRLSTDIQVNSNAILRSAVLSEQGNARLDQSLMDVRANLGRIGLERVKNASFEQSGVKVFSQWDEDGLIEYIVSHCDIPNRNFIEIGIGDYTEANTRFLLTERGWSGVVVDSTTQDIDKLQASEAYWRYPLTAVNAFVTAENVNELIGGAGLKGDIGLLSIDVDGVDYWIWNAVEAVSPRIVICEYNGLFGSKAKVTVPYEPAFDRRAKHYSWLYCGASLAALVDLAKRKGYTLVGCNAGGNNAFFVRDDVMAAGDLKPSATPYRKPTFRESHNPDGSLSFLDAAAGVDLIADLPVFDVERKKTIKVGDIDLVYG
jgi:hypothetical protein